MKKFALGLIVTLTLTGAVQSQNKKLSLPTEFEKEQFMDTFLLAFKDKQVTTMRPAYDTIAFIHYPNDKVCDFFDSVECGHLLRQIKSDNKREWRKKRMAKAGKRLSGTDKNIWHFSTPLFTTDRQFVVIGIGYYCGSLCGEGCTYIFRRERNKWVQWKKIICWVS
jgi:hypothetical protein